LNLIGNLPQFPAKEIAETVAEFTIVGWFQGSIRFIAVKQLTHDPPLRLWIPGG